MPCKGLNQGHFSTIPLSPHPILSSTVQAHVLIQNQHLATVLWLDLHRWAGRPGPWCSPLCAGQQKGRRCEDAGGGGPQAAGHSAPHAGAQGPVSPPKILSSLLDKFPQGPHHSAGGASIPSNTSSQGKDVAGVSDHSISDHPSIAHTTSSGMAHTWIW